jgi:hypothetical protein
MNRKVEEGEKGKMNFQDTPSGVLVLWYGPGVLRFFKLYGTNPSRAIHKPRVAGPKRPVAIKFQGWRKQRLEKNVRV